MLASAAIMVLAVYQPMLPPSSAYLPPTNLQQEQYDQRKNAQPAYPGQQGEGDGSVQDKAGNAEINTGLFPTESSGKAVVIPR
ncbi:MAG: hypothetical protein GW760_03800 [Legionella sp.]|jgi:hypothetical protein|nr:hypothetical protein [Legionella sp.]